MSDYVCPISVAPLKLAATIAEARSGDPFAPVTVVAPTQYAGLSLRRTLGGSTGLANVRFMVMARLAEYLGSPAMARMGKAPRSAVLQMAAIRQVSAGMQGHGPLGDIAGHPKLHESLRRTFADLAQLSETALQKLAGIDLLRVQLVQWYTESRMVLANYYNAEELARAATLTVESGEGGSVLRDLGFIAFYLAADLSPAERELVSALRCRNACCIIVGLTGEAAVDDRTWFSDNGPPGTHAVRAEGAGPPFERPRANHLLIASDTREEVSWVLRHMMRHAGQGVPFHRMAVIYRQADPYACLLRSRLTFAGVPVAGPDPMPLRETPAGKLVLYLLEILKDPSREAVMRWLCETPVRPGQAGNVAVSELARWDALSREAGIVGGAEQWQERLGGYIAALQERLADIEESGEGSPGRVAWLRANLESAKRLKLFMAELTSIEIPADGSTWTTFSQWAGELVKRFSKDPANWPEEQQSSYERVTGTVKELSSLDQLESGTSMTGFVRALSTALEASSGRMGQTGSGVFLAQPASCQGMEFDVVYIVGMAEGAFPPGVADDPMLPDSLRRSLGDNEALPSADMRRIEERRLFLAAMSAAPEVVLCYAGANASAGRAQYPSPWFLEEASRLHGARLGTDDLNRVGDVPWLSRIYSLQHGLGYVGTVSPADVHDYDMGSISSWHSMGYRLERHYLMEEAQVPGKAVRMERARKSAGLTEWDGRVPGMPEMGRPGADGRPVSPTSLETWATCPFRYFLGHVLKIATPESPEEVLTISSLERGALLHRILEQFFGGCAARGMMPGFGAPWLPAHATVLFEVAAGEFDLAEARGVIGKQVFWEATKEEVRRDLAAFLEEDSRWRFGEMARPMWAEKVFGMGGPKSLPPVEVSLPSGMVVSFRGKVDRVDECQAGPEGISKLNVVDYKFGSAAPFKDMDADGLAAGRHLQLPLYALAARLALPGPAEVRSLYWFATSKCEFLRKSVDLASVETRLREVLDSIIAMIQQGLFPANPGRDEYRVNCRYCDFKRVCPPDSDLAWQRNSQTPELAPYLGLASSEATEGEEA